MSDAAHRPKSRRSWRTTTPRLWIGRTPPKAPSRPNPPIR